MAILSGIESHGQQTTCMSCQQIQDYGAKTGHLYMVQNDNGSVSKQPVKMCAYKSGYRHYVVISPDHSFTNKSVHINLKNCKVKQSGLCEFTLFMKNGQSGGDVISVSFQTLNAHETAEWIHMMQHDNISNMDITNRKHSLGGLPDSQKQILCT